MKFNKLNMGQYNVMKVNLIVKCSVCNEDTNYVDYWSENKFCSIECQQKYYDWVKKNEKLM